MYLLSAALNRAPRMLDDKCVSINQKLENPKLRPSSGEMVKYGALRNRIRVAYNKRLVCRAYSSVANEVNKGVISGVKISGLNMALNRRDFFRRGKLNEIVLFSTNAQQ